MKSPKLLRVLFLAFLAFLPARENAVAQANNFDPNSNPNYDPQQMQEMLQQRIQQQMPQLQQQLPQLMDRMQQQQLNSYRQQLAVTNEVEWQVMEPLLSKVLRGQTDSLLGGAGALRMLGGNRGANLLGMLQSDPEREELQRLVDSGAPAKEIRNALSSYKEARKRKADELARDREQLRKVLTSRQEAILVLAGVLD